MRSLIWILILSTFARGASAETGDADVDANNILVDANSDRGYARHCIDEGDWDKATEYGQKCLKELDTFFKAHPDRAKKIYEYQDQKLTYASVSGACKQLQADIVTTRKQKTAASAVDSQRYMTELAEKNYGEGVGDLADARKLVKAGKLTDAVEQYDYAVQRLGVITANFTKILDKDSSLGTFEVPTGTAKPTWSARKMLDGATKMIADATVERDALKEKAAKQDAEAEARLAKSLKGDRAQLYRERGFPTWYDGANTVGMDGRNKAALTSPYWRYDSSSGCKTTFRFKGNKLATTSHEPAGCAD